MSHSIDSDEQQDRAWSERISWGAMLPLGWLIYELTARPSFGIVVACAKFGWNDFLTAHWLLRADPDRGRGRTCFWFYMASGLWKITVAAFLITGTLLIVTLMLDGKPPRGLIDVGATAAIGISLLAVVPLVGVIQARVAGVKVWIDPSVHDSRRMGAWPPQATGFNSAMGLLFPALLVPIVLTALVTIHLGLLPLLACVFGEGIYLWILFRGVAAERPDECWAEYGADPEQQIDDEDTQDKERDGDRA